MFRSGILGCGMIAGYFEELASPLTYSHAKAYRMNGGFSAIGVFDPNRSKAEVLSQRFGATAYNSLNLLLEEHRPDVVSVCTPDHTHASIILALLRHRYHPRLIFAEKPICVSSEEMSQIEAASREVEIPVIVNHSRRFDPAHVAICEEYKSGRLGGLLRGQVDYYGGWRHLGVHAVDLIQFIMGARMVPFSATVHSDSRQLNDPTLDVEASILGSPLRFSGFDEKNYQILEMKLLFENALVRLIDFGNQIEIWRKRTTMEGENVVQLDPMDRQQGLASPITRAMVEIHRYLETGSVESLRMFGMEEARATMETIWKVECLLGKKK